MTITQLHHFKVVAADQNMTQAAERCFISQSALSKSIASLEAELGTALFDREGKHITLNQYGARFLPYAEQVLEAYYAGVSAITSGEETKFHVVYPRTAQPLAGAVIDFCQCKFPEMHICPEHCDDAGLARLLDADLVLSHRALSDGPEWQLVCQELWCVVMSSAFPGAEQQTLTLAELARYPLAVHTERQDKDFMLACFLEHRLVPNVVMESNNDVIIRGEIAAGRAAAFVPYSVFLSMYSGDPMCCLRAAAVSDLRQKQPLYAHRKEQGKQQGKRNIQDALIAALGQRCAWQEETMAAYFARETDI